jgi:hypothetical protein
MQLTNNQGDSFEIQILGYQFPNMPEDEWDSNWLQIQLTVVLGQRAWTVTDPLLTTFEVERLADWLEEAKAGTMLEFAEPYLTFAFMEGAGGTSLRVVLNAWLVDSWKAEHGVGEVVRLDFPLNELDLRQARQSLREQLERFPRRIK